MDVVAAGFNLAHQWGCVMWGINVNASRVIYQQYKPFSLTQCVLGPFSAHLDHNLFYDERMKSKDDYDFSLQVLQRHKKILRLNKFYYKCDHGDNDGGIVSMRSMRAEKEACRAIMRKWGTDIIRYNLNAKKITDLLNAVVNIPIKGV